MTLQPHAHADVDLHALTSNIAGGITWTYRIEGAGKEPVFVHADGFIASVLDDPRPAIAFDAVDPSKAPVTKSVTFASSPYSNLRITKILSASNYLHARLVDDGKTLVTELGTDAPWGQIEEFVKVAIDTPVQKEVWVQVTADVQGEIGPRKNPFWVSGIPWGQRGDVKVPLVDQKGRDFTIGTVTSKDLAATYDNALCDPPAAGCRDLLVRISDAQAPGFFKVQLDIAFADRPNHLHLGLWGILGDKPQPGQEAETPTGPKPLPMAPPPSSEPAPPLKTEPDPPGEGPLLKWTIANQSSVHGYQVFRGESATGPFKLMDPGLIQTLDNGTGPVAYRWRDTSAVKGQTYFYYIAVIYKSGDRRALSGPQKTVAK
ncbi:MAG TPA: hypothetical protein VFV97_09245 [Rhodanobacteraceae bacterium]|nr:hypothetical protein [Rhodanobacteraceae bacterium]